MKNGILNDIRILDFTRVLAGPFATRILADFGAEVIKVQSKKAEGDIDSNLDRYYNNWNRNKRSITLDLSYYEARTIALKLASICDVVIENYSPRVMLNLGLDYQKMQEARPDLIMVSMSAMGQTGPWKDYVAYGPTVQSIGGLNYLTSYSKNSPIGLGFSYADMISGLFAAFSILSALEYRERTGKGQYVDLSEYEAICSLIGPALLDIQANNGEQLLPDGNQTENLMAAPYGCYQCLGEDRWCVIAVFNENEWISLCEVMGRPYMAKDNKFITPVKRKKHKKKLDTLIEQWTSKRHPQEVVQRLQAEGISAGLVQNAQDVANDQHLNAREYFVHIDHPLLGDTTSDRTPIKFYRSSKMEWESAPLKGQDNQYIFKELLGFTKHQISAFIKKGIID